MADQQAPQGGRTSNDWLKLTVRTESRDTQPTKADFSSSAGAGKGNDQSKFTR